MANRSMRAKAERAARQAREFGAREGAKVDRPADRVAAKTLVALVAPPSDLQARITAGRASYARWERGYVVEPAKDPAYASGLSRDIGREGKRRASRQTTCYGNGVRLKGGIAAECQSFEYDLLVVDVRSK